MKISEVTSQDLLDYMRISLPDESDVNLIINLMVGVKAYIKGYTGLDDATLDSKEDLTIVYMIIINEMYSNREYTVDNDKVNVVAKSILNMYSVNLL